MLIRPATMHDAGKIAEIQVRSWQAAYRGIVPQDFLEAMDPVTRAATTRAVLADPPPTTRVLVAVDDAGQTVGFVVFGAYRLEQPPGSVMTATASSMPPIELEPSIGEVRAIYVLPGEWGRGFGQLLMTTALRELSAQGRDQVRLWVLSANESARRFYNRAGFVPDGIAGVFRIERGTDPPVDLNEIRYVFDGRSR